MSRDVHSCTHWLRPAIPPSPRIWTRYTRALLVTKDRRHLLVTPWLYLSRGEGPNSWRPAGCCCCTCRLGDSLSPTTPHGFAQKRLNYFSAMVGTHIRRSHQFINKFSSLKPVKLFYSVADPGSVIRCLFDPWIRDLGWVKN